MQDLILYNYFRSSTSFRVRIALHLKNLDFEYRPVHLLKSEQHAPEFRRLNPLGEVPALIHKGNCIAQSLAILEYIDTVFPAVPIYPLDPQDRAWVRQFCENINAFIHPVCNLKILQYLEDHHQYGTSEKEAWISHWTRIGFKALEKMLEQKSKTYCMGDRLTAADLCLAPAVFSARRFHVPLRDFPLIEKIEKQLLDHPAFLKAHPYRQIDTPADLKIS